VGGLSFQELLKTVRKDFGQGPGFGNALKTVPIAELPFGAELSQGLPGTEDLDVGDMTYSHLVKTVRTDLKESFDHTYGQVVDDFDVSLVADLGFDFDANTHQRFGEQLILQADIDGRIALLGDEHLAARASVGAYYTNDAYRADATATYDTGDKQLWASLSAGYQAPTSSFRESIGLDTTFGDGVALGNASGRGTLHLDLGEDLDYGQGLKGYWGASADSDMSNQIPIFGLCRGIVFVGEFQGRPGHAEYLRVFNVK
jgi:hypothetical protein